MIPLWQHHRLDFNHDWFKNHYMNRLDGCIERLKTEDADVSRIVRFITQDFPEWEVKRAIVRELIASFEREMSPRALFEREPLNRCDAETQRWLSDLVQALWIVRYSIKRWVYEAEKALQSVDCQYTAIKQSLDALHLPDLGHLVPLLPSFITFKGACEKLSQAISQFPHEVLVV
jgi:hypothetical protein